MDAPPPLPPLSLADLFTIIGEQQTRIWQLTRALDAAQAAPPAPAPAQTVTRWPPPAGTAEAPHWLGSVSTPEATG